MINIKVGVHVKRIIPKNKVATWGKKQKASKGCKSDSMETAARADGHRSGQKSYKKDSKKEHIIRCGS